MKEKKVKLIPSFVRGSSVNGRGMTAMTIVGQLPRGGRVVIELTDMPSYMVKQLVRDGLDALQTRRNRALHDIEDVRRKAAE